MTVGKGQQPTGRCEFPSLKKKNSQNGKYAIYAQYLCNIMQIILTHQVFSTGILCAKYTWQN